MFLSIISYFIFWTVQTGLIGFFARFNYIELWITFNNHSILFKENTFKLNHISVGHPRTPTFSCAPKPIWFVFSSDSINGSAERSSPTFMTAYLRKQKHEIHTLNPKGKILTHIFNIIGASRSTTTFHVNFNDNCRFTR